MRLLFIFPTDYLASRKPLETVPLKKDLGASLLSVWDTPGKKHILVEVPLEGRLVFRSISLDPVLPAYLDVCWFDGKDVMTLSFEKSEGWMTEAPVDTTPIDWLGEEFTDHVDALMDRGVNPMSPYGLDELSKAFSRLEVGLFGFEALLENIREYVWATVAYGEFPIRDTKGNEPSWVETYREVVED